MPKTAITAIDKILDDLNARLKPMEFGPPVHYVYNPLLYARGPHRAYWRMYGQTPKEILFLGMNPGPWGMAQTGVPFGDAQMVRDWLGIRGKVETPARMHPKRPISGLECPRGEVSGRRLWGWARERFGTPVHFFKRFFVANYCPLVFMEQGGRNRTPDKLPPDEKNPLLAACDEALVRTVGYLQPKMVVGIGRFAALQARQALAGSSIQVGQITHPSPANPKANAGWADLIERELAALGIDPAPS